MMARGLASFLWLCTTVVAATVPHVVIVAGYKFYKNYRHQADACDAYQTLLRNGVPLST